MKAIKAEISSESLSQAAAQVRAIADSLRRDVNSIGSQLAEIGKAVAVANVGVESGELATSIKVEKTREGYQLIADTPYAVYHEFGTGAVGADNPYPYERPEGIGEPRSRYGKSSRNAWLYHDNDDPDTWWYYDEKQGRLRVTRGQRGRAFMGKAAEAMRQNVRPIAKAVIDR